MVMKGCFCLHGAHYGTCARPGCPCGGDVRDRTADVSRLRKLLAQIHKDTQTFKVNVYFDLRVAIEKALDEIPDPDHPVRPQKSEPHGWPDSGGGPNPRS